MKRAAGSIRFPGPEVKIIGSYEGRTLPEARPPGMCPATRNFQLSQYVPIQRDAVKRKIPYRLFIG